MANFIELTVLRVEELENGEPGEVTDFFDKPYQHTINTDTINDVFVQDSEGCLTAVCTDNIIFYVDQSYEVVKRALGVITIV